jgi:hypothetical protein
MTRSQDIEEMAADAYQLGVSALDFTQALIEVLAEETLGIDCGHPAATLLARRITGALLEAGWAMPAPQPLGAAGRPAGTGTP